MAVSRAGFKALRCLRNGGHHCPRLKYGCVVAQTLEAISFRVKNGITGTIRPIPVVIIAERVTPDT